jgi:CrcB protein
MREVIWVAIGGSLGALVRYGAGLAAGRYLGAGFPWGTLAVNVTGCFLMGIVLHLILGLESHSGDALTPAVRWQLSLWRHGVAVGFLGGLTTFSSFGADTIRELQAGQIAVGLANIAANLLLSLVALWAGLALMQAVD